MTEDLAGGSFDSLRALTLLAFSGYSDDAISATGSDRVNGPLKWEASEVMRRASYLGEYFLFSV